jgi:hypothetical protein
MMIAVEVYRPRGKGWQYLGTYSARSDKGAALDAGYVHNLKVIGTRPADTDLPLRVWRFKYVPLLTSSSGSG